MTSNVIEVTGKRTKKPKTIVLGTNFSLKELKSGGTELKLGGNNYFQCAESVEEIRELIKKSEGTVQEVDEKEIPSSL